MPRSKKGKTRAAEGLQQAKQSGVQFSQFNSQRKYNIDDVVRSNKPATVRNRKHIIYKWVTINLFPIAQFKNMLTKVHGGIKILLFVTLVHKKLRKRDGHVFL